MAKIDSKASRSISRTEPAKLGASNPHTGMILFLVSETFLFGALFWTYYYLRTTSPAWPPQGISLDAGLAIINTIILLASSVTFWWATRAIQKNSRNGLATGLLITILLGATFLTITGWEWVHETFRPWSHAYGSTFFTLTGFHALHVFGGIVFMVFLLIRTLRHRFSATEHVAVDAGSLYWHFVDFIWLIVFTSIFIIK